MFHVGQMVVCVDDSMRKGVKPFRGERLPIRGNVYTVRGIDTDSRLEEVGLLLEEIVNPLFLYDDEYHELKFRVSRFRPVRQTSIEQFTSILNQAPQREDA